MTTRIKNNTRKFSLIIVLGVLNLFTAKQVRAQSADFQSVYFQNQYLVNPAMAGLVKGLNLNAGYQRQWTTVPGSPTLQNLTADYNMGNRVGLGLNITNDNEGLISRTRIMGTYAYHLPLNAGNDKLSFGLSAGFNDIYIDQNKIVADPNDILAQNFNQRSLYFDGDIGVAYTSSKFNIQAAVPNLRSVFGSTAASLDVNRTTFYTAMSYKAANDGDALTIEPKVAYRGLKGFANVFDAGVNVALNNNQLNFTGMYHTDQSATLAFGLNLDNTGVLLAYTNNTGALRTYANNTFELGLTYRLGVK